MPRKATTIFSLLLLPVVDGTTATKPCVSVCSLLMMVTLRASGKSWKVLPDHASIC